jgi:hypothetical protein
MIRTLAKYAPLLLLVSGCYHATIETGAPVSNETIHQPFASSWIYGLVPPKTVSATSQCRTGVARVETQLSFVNQLVGFLTLGIYTPMEIKVTCAASRADASIGTQRFAVHSDASAAVFSTVFAAAADHAVETRTPAFVDVITPALEH